VVRAMWGRKRPRRCPEIVLTLFGKGHRLDPLQACVYTCIAGVRNTLIRRPDLQPTFARVWANRRRGGLLRDGNGSGILP
jgi:hypothetical protein